MTWLPKLQSWCIVPEKNDIRKFTKAHQFLQQNPSVKNEILNHDFRIPQTSFRVRVLSVDKNGNKIDKIALIGLISDWCLLDVLDIEDEGKEKQSYIVRFKTSVSAHVITKIANLQTEVVDEIPKDARVPLVYIQGIGIDVMDDEIISFFRTLTPILKVKTVQKGNVVVRILKLPSIKNALMISQRANHENFKNFKMTVSHQYKSSVTRCFFITSIIKTSLQQDDVNQEVSSFGEIETLFTRMNGSLPEFYIKMKEKSDAKLACGIMNGRSYDNAILTAIFITPEYFDELFNSTSKQVDA